MYSLWESNTIKCRFVNLQVKEEVLEMKKIMGLVLTIVMISNVSMPALATESSSRAQYKELLKEEEFSAHYVGTSVVNEVIEEVPNSDICFIYQDLENGNSIAYMIQAGEVVYKAYAEPANHRLTEYRFVNAVLQSTSAQVYTQNGGMTSSSRASATFAYAGQIKYRTPADHMGTIVTKYLDCNYREEYKGKSTYNVAKDAQNKAAYAGYLVALMGIPIGLASTVAGLVMGIFGIGTSMVGFSIPDHTLYANENIMYWTIKDSEIATNTFSYQASKYIITDEEQLHEVYEDPHYYLYSDFINENEEMAEYFKQQVYSNYNIEPVDWIHAG